jgi:predicted regulator of Ras-like GTPase activity (Roadblock/LC7/MglB family)
MSTITQGIKFKLGGIFKQLFQKPEPAAPAPVNSPAVPQRPVYKSVPVRPGTQARTASTLDQPGNTPLTPGVDIPLQSILAILPVELKSQVCQEDVTGLMYSAPITIVLPQLASGAVKIPFGEVRKSAPEVFAGGEESDGVNILLPLPEILSQLNPALLTRRPTQKQLIVPDDISSPFAGRGDGLTLAVGNNSPQAPKAPQAAAPAPVSPVQRASSAPGSNGIQSLTKPLPGGTDMFQRKPAANGTTKPPIFPRKPGSPTGSSTGTEIYRKPAAPTPPHAPTPEFQPSAPIAFKPTPSLPSGPVSPIAPSPAAAPEVPAVPPRPKDILAAPPVARSMQPAKPAAAPAASAAETQTLLVPLSAIIESWPDAVRQEIVQSKLVDSRLAMPVDKVEESLRRGRVVFAWKTLRSWVRPGPVPPTSPHDLQELELPLAVLAPLFVARRKANDGQSRVVVSEAIPNLFFGLPKAEAPAAPKPADTNYYAWNDAGQPRTDDADTKQKAAGGTDLLLKCATPNEIVSRAAAMNGVAGALIALPDGLMVASRIPAEFNGDTLAAFLPHIFSKVNQCTKELRMGELNNLNFTVGNVPWKIFRVNAIFFAVFGRVGEGLPTADLTALAAELERKRS